MVSKQKCLECKRLIPFKDKNGNQQYYCDVREPQAVITDLTANGCQRYVQKSILKVIKDEI